MDAVKFKVGLEMYPNFVLLRLLITDILIISLIYVYPTPIFTEGRAGSILGRVLGKFQVISCFCLLFSSPGAHPVSNRSETQRNFLGSKVRPALGVDSSAALVVSNIQLRIAAQNSTLPLSLYDLLWEIFTFTKLSILLYINP